MSFTFSERVILKCEDCGYISTERHFSDETYCPLCDGSGQQTDTIEPQTGVAPFKYRKTLTDLEENAAGVGQATVSNIEEVFGKDDFFDVCKHAYKERTYDALTEVDGVGKATAETICEHVAADEGWERPTFQISES